MYICKICNFETSARTALYNHNKSKKHTAIIQNKKLLEEKQIIEQQTKEIDELKKELIKIKQEKDKEIQNTKLEIYKELSQKGKTINNNNKIVINNNLSYVNKHFENAPPLQKMTNFVLNGIDLNDDTQLDKIVDQIIYAYNNNCLHKLIGDHIIKNYKKDNLQ